MTAEIPKPAEIRKTRGYFWRRLISKWPFLVWLGMAILTYQLYQRGVRFERINGVVIAETEIISSLEQGMIQEMFVHEVGESVDAGAPVVQMDPRFLIGERDALQQKLKADGLDLKRKTAGHKTELNNELQKLKNEKAADEVRLEVLRKAWDDAVKRRAEGVGRQRDVDEAKEKFDLLDATFGGYKDRIEFLEKELEAATQLVDDIERQAGEKSVMVTLLEDRIERMKRTSVNGGKVSMIYFRAGAVVDEGAPIVEIVNDKALSVRGFIMEENADEVSVGKRVYISPSGESAPEVYLGKITFIAPQISQTADVGSSVAGRTIKGREILCSFDDPDVDLIPNQSVTIHLEEPGKLNIFSFGKK